MIRVISKYFLLLTFSFAWQAHGQGNGIIFRNLSMQEALAAAKQEGRLVFMHGFAEWCGHCKTMAEQVYTDSLVGKFYNENFICLKYDFEKEGKDIAKSLKANSYPALIFFNAEGKVVYRVKGERKKEPFIQLGKDAMDPEKQLPKFEQKFSSGTATYEESLEYFRMLEQAGLDIQKLVNSYLSKYTVDQLLEPQQWNVIFRFLKDHRQPAAKTFIANKKSFENIYTSDSVNSKIQGIYVSELIKRQQRLDTTGYKKLQDEIRASGLDIADKICAYADLTTLRIKSKWPEYMALAPAFIRDHGMNDVRRLQEAAQNFAERSSDSIQLAMAEEWAKRAVELSDSYKNNMTLASVQIKLKKRAEAQKTAEHALVLGQQSNVDVKQLYLLMEKIEKLN